MRFCLLFCAMVGFAQDPVCELRTIAGPVTTDAGDGGPALEAQFLQPTAMAVAKDGSIYVADSGNDKIRRIAPDGTIETVAGNGVRGFSGDGGLAKDAALFFPTGLALDADVNVYIVEKYGHRLRRVDARGVIVTLAGTGEAGFTTAEGPALEMKLSYPDSVAVLTDGRVLIADTLNRRILELRDGQLRTVAGSRDPLKPSPAYRGDEEEAIKVGLVSPLRIVAGRNDDYYFYDSGRVWSVNSRGLLRTVVGGAAQSLAPPDGAPASQLALTGQVSLAVDLDGNLIFIPGIAPVTANFPWILNADGTVRALDRSLRLDAGGLIVSPTQGILFTSPDGLMRFETGKPLVRFAGLPSSGFAGDGGPAVNALFANPTSVTISGGLIYVIDAGNRRIRRMDSNGQIETFAGTGILASDDNPIEARLLNILSARDIAADLEGNVWLVDSGKARIQRLSPEGTVTTVLGPGFINVGGPDPLGGTMAGTMNPFAIGADRNGDVFFSDSASRGGYYRRIALKEQMVHTVILSSASPSRYFRSPSGTMVALAPTPNTGAGAAFFELTSGEPRSFAAPVAFQPSAATLTPDGTLYFSDFRGLYRRTVNGKTNLIWGLEQNPPGTRPAYSGFSGLTSDNAATLSLASNNASACCVTHKPVQQPKSRIPDNHPYSIEN